MFLEDSRKSENDMRKEDEKRRVIGMLQIFAARFGMFTYITYITHILHILHTLLIFMKRISYSRI